MFNFSASSTPVTFTGGDGNNIIIGSNFDDVLNGGGGNDILTGGAGNDVVSGGVGNDILIAGSGGGNDSYDGGADFDTLLYTSTSLGITVSVSSTPKSGSATGLEIYSDSFQNIEAITGGAGADSFVVGSVGGMFFSGGSGNDSLSYAPVTSALTVDLGAGTVSSGTLSGLVTDTFSAFEAFTGGSADDAIRGSGGNDFLNGGGGNDTIFGSGGNDQIDGGSGVNTLIYDAISGVQVDFEAGTVSGADFIDTFSNIASAFVTNGVVNFSTSNFSGTGTLTIQSASTLIAHGSATIATDITNAGVIQIEAGATLDIGDIGATGHVFQNTGTLVVDGDLTLTDTAATLAAGTNLQIASGSRIDLIEETDLALDTDFTLLAGRIIGLGTGAGPAALTGAGTLTNQGNIEFSGGILGIDTINAANITTTDGKYTVDGTLTLNDLGTIDLSGSKLLAGAGTYLSLGTLTLNGDIVAASFVQQAGDLDIVGNVTVDGVLQLGAAASISYGVDVLGGVGTLVNQNDFDIFSRDIDVLHVVNEGRIGFGDVTLTGSEIINTVTGTFEVGLDGGGAIDMEVGETATNAGLIDILSFSNFDFLDGVLENSGVINIGDGGELAILGGTLSLLDGGTLTGSGSVTLASELNIGAGVDFLLGSGGPSIELTNGDIAGGGTITNDSSLAFLSSGLISVATFTNTGDMTFNAGTYTIGSGAGFTNEVGGTMLLNGDNGVAFVDLATDITNLGLIAVNTNNSSATGVLRFDGQTLTNAGTIQIDGVAGAAPNMFGNIVNTGLLDINNFFFQTGFGDISNTGTIDISDASRLSFGQGSGTTNFLTNEAAGTITLNNSGSFVVELDNRIINNGVLDFGGGELLITSGGTFTQNLDLALTTAGAKIDVGFGGTGGTLDGAGTLTLGAGTTLGVNASGNVALDIVNSGVIDSSDGQLNFDGTVFNQTGGAIDLAGSATLTGAGSIVNQSASDITLQDDTIDLTFVQSSAANGTATLGGVLDIGGALVFKSGAQIDLDTFGGVITTGTGTIDNGTTLQLTSDQIGIGHFINRGFVQLNFNGTITTDTFDNVTGATLRAEDIPNRIEMTNNGTFTNDGLIQINGFHTLTFEGGVLANAGQIDIGPGDNGTLDVIGGTLSMRNGGSLTVGGGIGHAVNIDTEFNIAADVNYVHDDTEVAFNLNGGTITGPGTLTNQSEINFNDGAGLALEFTNTGDITLAGAGTNTFNIADASENLVGGVMTISSAATFDMGGAGVFTNNGNFILNTFELITVQEGEFLNDTSGTLSGFGTISLGTNGTFTQNGTDNTGASPGEITIGGNVTRGDSSHMITELAGLAPATEFDVYNVTGIMDLAGTMTVEQIDDFAVDIGDSFAVVSAGQLNGSFHEINGLDVGGGVVIDADQSATGITLTGVAVTHQGDGGDNTLTGGGGNDVFSAGDGNDTIVSNGGDDLMHGGDGDDLFIVRDTSFGRVDGGNGFDLITFDGAGESFDLTALRGDQFSSIEALDLTGSGDNALLLDSRIAFAATSGINAETGTSHSLIIEGDAGDSVNFQDSWNNTGSVTIGDNGYSVYQSVSHDAQVYVDNSVTINAEAA